MQWYAFNFALGSIISFFAGLFVLYRGESRNLTRRTWFSLCLFVSLWHAGKLLMQLADTAPFAAAAVYPIYVSAIAIPPVYLHFILSLLEAEDRRRAALMFCYALALVELVLLFSGRLTAGVRLDPSLGYYEVPNHFYGLYVASFVVIPSVAIFHLLKALRDPDLLAVKRNQFKYVAASSLTGFLLGANSFLPFVTDAIPPVGAPLVYFYTLPITYAVARFRLLEIDVAIKRSLIYALLLLILLVPCYLMVIWGQQLAFASINYTYSLSTLLLFIVVGFVFPKLRFRTEEALEGVLFRKRADYRETLLRSSQEMVSVVDLKALSESLVQTVWRALGIDKVSLFLLDEGKGTFVAAAHRGFESTHGIFPILPNKSTLAQMLGAARKPLVREEIELAKGKDLADEIVERMHQLEAEISVPIISQQKLIGILNLGHKGSKKIYSNEELELLSTLANQAAIALENARLYENLRQSQHTLRRADRLSSLGLLTAGLAHEIRNPLVAIRTFTQLLPERYDDPEFREGFQGLALKEVDRICGLINDLLSFARPSRPNVAEENMNDVVDGIARILETEAKEKGVEIRRDFGAELPRVWIDSEQLKQVFMNLILNAIQAMKHGGSIVVSTRLKNASKESGQTTRFVEVEVRDTGVGIPEENLEHIFDPFFTSKDEGSGLGLSISHQIIQEHGGFILVSSKVGTGTSFFINLPTGKPIRAPIENRT